MSRAVSISIQKGGTGKTTIAINLGERLANRGHDVLLVDLDPQGHLTEGIGLSEAYTAEQHIGDLLLNKSDTEPEDVLTTRDPFDVIPSNRDLDDIEPELRSISFGVLKLRRTVVEPLLDNPYEYIIIDAPPSLGALSDNALVGAGNVIIPIETREPSVRGLEQMINKQIQPIRNEMDLKILAIVPNKLRGDNEDKRIIEKLETHFMDVLPSFAKSDAGKPGPGIRERIAISRAWRDGQTLAEYDPNNDMLQRFDILADIVENGGINNG